jgi:hypothetical protein
MGWDGMGWDGMGWDGMGWDGMGWHGMAWDGMGWDGMGWDGMGWDGPHKITGVKGCGVAPGGARRTSRGALKTVATPVPRGPGHHRKPREHPAVGGQYRVVAGGLPPRALLDPPCPLLCAVHRSESFCTNRGALISKSLSLRPPPSNNRPLWHQLSNLALHPTQ